MMNAGHKTNLHIQNILQEEGFDKKPVVKEYLTTAKDGKNYKKQADLQDLEELQQLEEKVKRR
ncbi:MAG: hypothetical protein ACQERD_12185 [Campylobacterota bacterium]